MGQSQTDNAPATLEELTQRVTDLENRVSELESQQEPAGDDDSVEAAPPETPADSSTGDAATISGVGTTLSESLYLEAGLYRVDAAMSVTNGFGDFLSVEVAGSNEWDDMIFMEFAEGNGDYEYSTNWTAQRSEEYFFQVDCMSAWSLSFMRLR